MMEITKYADMAMTTCLPTCETPLYMMGLLHEEAGELQGKHNKALRKGLIDYKDNQMIFNGTFEEQMAWEEELKKELGDVMWAVAGICHVFKWDIEAVAQDNLDKLASRKQRGVIVGDGDNR